MAEGPPDIGGTGPSGGGSGGFFGRLFGRRRRDTGGTAQPWPSRRPPALPPPEPPAPRRRWWQGRAKPVPAPGRPPPEIRDIPGGGGPSEPPEPVEPNVPEPPEPELPRFASPLLQRLAEQGRLGELDPERIELLDDLFDRGFGYRPDLTPEQRRAAREEWFDETGIPEDAFDWEEWRQGYGQEKEFYGAPTAATAVRIR